MRVGQRIIFGVAIALVTVAAARYVMAQAGAAAVATPAAATNSADFFTPEKLQAIGQEMLAKAKASPGGSAGETIETYPGHYITITARTKSGGGEFHTHYNDIFVVLDGEGTELTGGSIPDMKMGDDGEGRGTAVVGGTPHKLTKGDVLHINFATPHQAVMEPGKSLILMVIKVHQD